MKPREIREPGLMPGFLNSKLILMAEELRYSDSVVDTKSAKRGDGSYVHRYTKCGKPTCQCAKSDKLNRPHWYLYTKDDGKTRCKYIGKSEPAF